MLKKSSDIYFKTLKDTSGDMYFLPLEEQIIDILKRNEICFQHDNCSHSLDAYCDILDGDNIFYESYLLYFIMHTDGISLVMSIKLSIWPILLSIVNLLPYLRHKTENIVLCALYIGHSKPD